MHYRVTKIHQSSTIENEEMPPLDVVSEFDIVASSEEIQDRVTLESIEVGTPLGVMHFAPMMTFQKYLTMQVCASWCYYVVLFWDNLFFML